MRLRRGRIAGLALMCLALGSGGCDQRESNRPANAPNTSRRSASSSWVVSSAVEARRNRVMTPADHVPLAEVKNRLSEVVDRLEREHGRVVITKHGRPAAVMLSLEDLESLEETLAILSDPELLAAIREADAEVAAGTTTRMSRREALDEIER